MFITQWTQEKVSECDLMWDLFSQKCNPTMLQALEPVQENTLNHTQKEGKVSEEGGTKQ